jgi:hypothetical protein
VAINNSQWCLPLFELHSPQDQHYFFASCFSFLSSPSSSPPARPPSHLACNPPPPGAGRTQQRRIQHIIVYTSRTSTHTNTHTHTHAHAIAITVMVEQRHRVAVVGAGVAGCAMAGALKDHGIDFVVFDKHPGPGGLWADNYPNAAGT